MYRGGKVLATDGLTITPIYWAPSGYSFPDPYTTIVNQYLADIAAASGQSDNTYALTTEYYQMSSDGNKQPVRYQISAGTPVSASDPIQQSSSPCPVKDPYTACVTQDQIRAELTTALGANGLPADTQHIYVLLLPRGVQTCEANSCSGDTYCGIHQSFQPDSGGTIIYGDEPYITAGCMSGQSPNGDPAADAQVSVLSHELIETITDPLTPGAWFDSAGNEIGDECNFNFGPPMGSVDSNNPQTTEYNQVINGHNYWTQTMFSNAAYAAMGVGKGCVSSAFSGSATATPAAYKLTAADAPSQATLDLSDTKVDADGKSTSTATLTVFDGNGEPVSGDHIHFDVSTSDETPNAACGAVKPAEVSTDDNGQAQTTYTSSTGDVACVIIGIDAESGSSDWGTIYQGTAADDQPAITDASVPSSLSPGEGAQTFTVTAQNPSQNDIGDARFDVFLTGDDNGAHGSIGLNANQVHVAYSDSDTGGAFTSIPLTGETTKDGEIDGYVMPDKAADLPAGGSRTVTFQISLDSSAPTSAQTGAPLHIETDLDQFNPADGSTDNLDYVGPADITVGGASGGFPVWVIVVIVAGAGVLGGLAFVLQRRSRRPGPAPA